MSHFSQNIAQRLRTTSTGAGQAARALTSGSGEGGRNTRPEAGAKFCGGAAFLGALCLAALFSFLFTGASAAQESESVLHTFAGGTSGDGANPYSGLIADAHGNLYGTTETGGAGYLFFAGSGTVFKLSPPSNGSGPWTETVLHSFISFPPYLVDAANPYGSLVFDASGNLYGTGSAGGANNEGSVFKLTPPAGGMGSWTETRIYDFGGVAGDGATPRGNLIFDSSGNLYGTTISGGYTGSGFCSALGGCGTVFKLSPPTTGTTWTETILYSFQGANDGAGPAPQLIFDAQGNLYGTTEDGVGMSSPVEGTVFELTPPTTGTTWTETTLFSFPVANLGQGVSPNAGVIFDSTGNLYGTTFQGGAANCGVVYELTPPATGVTWSENVLHSFTCGSDGGDPAAPLIFDAAGNLYSTASAASGTQSTSGTVFALSPPITGSTSWTERTLYTFSGSNGSNPRGGLYRDAVGNLYGTTASGGSGGSSGFGVAFELTRQSTTTTVSASPSPSTGGAAVTFTVTVIPAPSFGTDLGYITVKANGTALGSKGFLSADNGVATVTYSSLLPSTTAYSIQAFYSGSIELAPSSSSVVPLTVNVEPTTTTLSSGSSALTYGQPDMLTATVATTNGATPRGTVSFTNGSTMLGNASLQASAPGHAQAVLATSALPAGTDSVTASYLGSNLLQGSSSMATMIAVSQATSTLSLATTNGSIVYGQPATVTATVAPQDGGVAGGTVTFTRNGVAVATVNVGAGNTAVINASALGVGALTVGATFNGDSNVGGSTAATISQTVNKDSSTTVTTSSASGTTVTITTTVSTTSPGTAAPSGAVAFYNAGSSTTCGGTRLGNANLSGGTATLKVTLADGTYNLCSVYEGNGYEGGSTSPTETQTVGGGAT